MDLADLVRKMSQDPTAVLPDEKYAPVAHVETHAQAVQHLGACIAHLRAGRPELTLAQASQMERAKIGYLAGSFPYDVRVRVERLYRCVHPFAGAVDAKRPHRPIQLGSAFAVMVAAWDKQSPESYAFGAHRQPVPTYLPEGT